MKNSLFTWIGLLGVVSVVLAACGGSSSSPRTGDEAIDFTLPDSNGNSVTMSDSLQDNSSVALVFYHSEF